MSKRNKILTALITVLIMVLVSCGITIGYHYLYVKPVNNIIVESVNKTAQYAHDLEGKQKANQQQITEAIDFLVALQSSLLLNTVDYRENVGKAFKEVIVNFESAEERIKTLERRHLELLRAIAILDKKHWDPAKAAEASGLEWKE